MKPDGPFHLDGPFRLGERTGRSLQLSPGVHQHPDDEATRQHWLKAAGLLGEGHCPTCSGRLERLEQWAHCEACQTCWQLGVDRQSGDKTISWMSACRHHRFDVARFFRIDDVKELIRRDGSPAAKRDILFEEES